MLLTIAPPAASTLPSATESPVEAKPTAESTMEAKPRSETTMECEGAGSESAVEAKPTTESPVEAKAASAEAAAAEADCGKAVTARVRDTEGAPAGKGRRSQH
jgi:hypothetical protein